MTKKVKGIIRNKIPNIFLFILIDLFVLLFSSIFAVWIRFDFGTVPEKYLVGSYQYLAIDFIIVLITFLLFRLYTSMWKYASVIELINIIMGCTFAEIVMYIYKHIFNINMPRSYYLIQIFLLITLTCFSRLGYRMLRTIYINYNNKKNTTNTILVGAGEAGRLIIDEINNNGSVFDTRLVCVVDDDKSKIGSYIKGIKVEGSIKDISYLANKYKAKSIIIAIPSVSKKKIDKIVTECHKTNCDIKILPSIYLSMKDNRPNIVSQIRPLSYEDFLGRDQIVVDDIEINNSLKNKIILVTGGGGSIGSELCRQIASSNPKSLIIFDIYENNAYDIEQELLRNFPTINLHTIIGSIRDYDRLEQVFKKYKPDYVYHAAAHKHVPLMEFSPNEVIKNNVLGTLNLCKLASIYKTKKFVLISTDKAVRPTNIMGASKRICEMIIQSFDKKNKNTDYVAVRFGNVLGSNGSVINLFLKQIDSGGPVTVTSKEITRYFMTIPEAVSLVLQAGCFAKGGEIFVLDMGKPVKIYDLACKLIRYKGYIPNKDISIKIIGLRPGEKLYEERLMAEEGLERTPNKLINIGKPLNIPKSFFKDLDNLIKSANQNVDNIKELVASIVTTYKIDKESGHKNERD
ncbi:MAG: polysaccharide biosynthesis protein [Bacilli bacterium]|nr:polysaccharide biosynthesis protein [Bacilli bacterium]